MLGVIHSECFQLQSVRTHDLGHSSIVTSAAQLGKQKQSVVHNAYGTSTVKTPGYLLRRVGDYPRSRVSRHFFVPWSSLRITVMATDWKSLELA